MVHGPDPVHRAPESSPCCLPIDPHTALDWPCSAYWRRRASGGICGPDPARGPALHYSSSPQALRSLTLLVDTFIWQFTISACNVQVGNSLVSKARHTVTCRNACLQHTVPVYYIAVTNGGVQLSQVLHDTAQTSSMLLKVFGLFFFLLKTGHSRKAF